MIVRVEAFTYSYGNTIPIKYTCDGEEISPGLTWHDVPEGTKSFTLIMEGLDIPSRSTPLTLWIVFDIPGDVREITTNAVPEFAKLGTNDRGEADYSGPCPEPGPDIQRYCIKLYALDIEIDLPAGETKQSIETAMKDHILATAEVIATYKRHT